MITITFNNITFELYSYTNPKNAPLSFLMNPGEWSLTDIVDLLITNKHDILIKNDTETVARFVNYTELISISQNFDQINKVNVVIQHPSDQERIEHIEEAIGVLDTNMENVTGNVQQIQGTVSNLSSDITIVSGKVNTATQNISALNTNINTVSGQVKNLNNTVGEIGVNVSNLDENMSEAKDNIEVLNVATTQGSHRLNIAETDIILHADLLDVIQDAIDDIIMG